MREGSGDVGEFGKHHETFGARNKLFELTQSIAPGNYWRNGHHQLYQGSAVVVKVSLCMDISDTMQCRPL